MNAITPIVAAQPAQDVETALWTGKPGWHSAAVHVWKVRWAAGYFALLLADGARLALTTPHAASLTRLQVWSGELKLLAIAAVTLAGLFTLAALTARTTRYSIEARTVTLRYGLALPARLVIPYAAIAQVDVRIHADGSGDLSLKLKPGKGVAYLKLWPHARPWRWLRPEPMLRGIPDAGPAAALLCRRLGQTPSPQERRANANGLAATGASALR